MLKAKILLSICICLLIAAISLDARSIFDRKARKANRKHISILHETPLTEKEKSLEKAIAEGTAESESGNKQETVVSATASKKKPGKVYSSAKKSKKIKKAKKVLPSLRLLYEVSARYDSNVYGYSSSSISQYKNNQNRNTKFRHVRSIGDEITRVSLDLSKLYGRSGNHPTRVGVGVESDIYAYNPINNEQTYSFYARHQLNKKTSLEINYEYTPYHFVKYLLDTDIPSSSDDRYAKAYYKINKVDAIARYWPVRDWYLRLRYRFELDDWNGSFNERDAVKNSMRLDATKSWSYGAVRAGIFYDYSYSDARAHDDDPGQDIDPSYGQNKLGLLLRLPFYRKSRIEAEYSYAYRSFTSQLSIEDDPLHRNRLDRIQVAKTAILHPFTKNSEWFLEYVYEDQDPHLKSSPGDSDSEPYLGYIKNIVTLGVKGRF